VGTVASGSDVSGGHQHYHTLGRRLDIPFSNKIPWYPPAAKLHMGCTHLHFEVFGPNPYRTAENVASVPMWGGMPRSATGIDVAHPAPQRCGWPYQLATSLGQPHKLLRAENSPQTWPSCGNFPDSSRGHNVSLPVHLHPVSQGTEAPERWRDTAFGPLHC